MHGKTLRLCTVLSSKLHVGSIFQNLSYLQLLTVVWQTGRGVQLHRPSYESEPSSVASALLSASESKASVVWPTLCTFQQQTQDGLFGFREPASCPTPSEAEPSRLTRRIAQRETRPRSSPQTRLAFHGYHGYRALYTNNQDAVSPSRLCVYCRCAPTGDR